jgi:NAD(P)-dependent dehydrogenase (short-subunit alcohol dehydrogenase family)
VATPKRSARGSTRSRNAELPDLAGKTAIVTGAACGIGRATTLALVAGGARVIGTDLDEFDAPVGVTVCVADVRSEDDWRRVVAAGGVDVLVNNAGGYTPPTFPDAPAEHWASTLDVNLKGAMLGIQTVLPSMRERGGGAIVNVSSVAALVRKPYESPEYAAAKAGVLALTTSLGGLWESDRISITSICPDWVRTEAVERAVAAMSDAERAELPGLVPVEEIVGLILRLATDDSLAGRVMVRWADEDGERLLPRGRET